jgi:hypothetical protein
VFSFSFSFRLLGLVFQVNEVSIANAHVSKA